MDETKKLSKFIVDWERLHTIMALIELESALTLHSCVSVTDNLKMNEPKNPIAKGPLYLHTEFETNWTKIWQFRTPWVIRSHNIDTELV